MSVWRWFRRGRSDGAPRAPEPVAAALDVEAFETLLGTDRERAWLDAVLAAHRRGGVSSRVAARAALTFAERGEEEPALLLCEPLEAPEARLLAADLRARRGELSAALRHVERLLADHFDWPGALERHQRWAAKLSRVTRTPALDLTLLGSAPSFADLSIVREIGRGGSATVYEAADAVLERRVALKVYHRAAEQRARLLREAQLAARFAGDGVIRVYDARPEPGAIALEWVEGGSLKARLQSVDAHWLWPLDGWFVPLLEALARVHDAGFVHGDLKPANVLLRRPGDPVLADFGVAGPVFTPAAGGSLGYIPPERDPAAPLRPSDDVFAMGRILAEVLIVLGERQPRWEAVAQAALAPARPPTARALLQRLGEPSAPT